MSINLINNGDTGEVARTELNSAIAWINAYGTPATRQTETFTLDATNISNKYIDLVATPIFGSTIDVFPTGGIKQLQDTDFEIITDGSSLKRLSWSTLELDGILEVGDILYVEYVY